MRGDHPNSWKNAPRMQGRMKIFRVGSRQFRESLRELLRELWVSYWSSRERPFREWNFVFREWNFQFRELLREYPGTLRELREWPFHSESVFPEIGVVPRLLKLSAVNYPLIVCSLLLICLLIAKKRFKFNSLGWATWEVFRPMHFRFSKLSVTCEGPVVLGQR